MEDTQQKKQQEKKPKLWTINYILICLSTISLMVGFAALFPTLPIYVEKYGNISGITGLPLAALTLGAVITRPIAGWSLDLFGRKIFLYLMFLLSYLCVSAKKQVCGKSGSALA